MQKLFIFAFLIVVASIATAFESQSMTAILEKKHAEPSRAIASSNSGEFFCNEHFNSKDMRFSDLQPYLKYFCDTGKHYQIISLPGDFYAVCCIKK
jgi:hypothetical protein